MISLGSITTMPCVANPSDTGSDARCDDPAFSFANPDICQVGPRLIIKPGLALLCALGSVQFSAVIFRDGIEEDITTKAIWRTSNGSVILVGAVSGNATGVAEGNASIYVSYEGLTAHADVSVLAGSDCCDDASVALMVMVDNTKSMGQAFNSSYPTKLAFAKAAAEQIIGEINEEKDSVGLMKFTSEAATILSEPTSDKDAVEALVAGITQTQQSTSYYDALSDAIDSLNAADVDRRAIVLITDGEDQTESYAQDNPIALLDDFKAAGGIVIVLGVRSHGGAYSLLSALATGGFFINAHNLTAEASIDYVSGIKGYVCSGNCTPEGDVYEAKGTLNYDDFINWDVVGGYVDLQGNGFFDYLPGNGLYVDLISGMQPDGDPNPVLTLRDAISIVAGTTYRVSLQLAGNQVLENNTGTIELKVVSDTAEHLSQLIHIDDYTQPFQFFNFSFRPLFDDDVRITIQQTESEGLPTPIAAERGGVLLKSVRFEDLDSTESLFYDDFDNENLTYIPPACGTGETYAYLEELGGYGYATGDSCYGAGCLEEPPIVQTQDPSPLSDIESGYTPPQLYTSTKTVCRECPSGFINDSDTNLVPEMTSEDEPSGEAFGDDDTVGHEPWRAFDQDASSYWLPSAGQTSGILGYEFATAKAVGNYSIVPYTYSMMGTPLLGVIGAPGTWTFEGSNNGTAWTVLDTRTDFRAWLFDASGNARADFPMTNATAYKFYRLNITASSGTPTQNLNVVALEMYAPSAAAACATETAESEVSQADADQKAVAAATVSANAALNCRGVYTASASATAKCTTGFGQDVTRSATRTSFISYADALSQAQAAALAEAEDALDCTLSNNTQKLCILDSVDANATCDSALGGAPPTKASPYPGVKFVSGVTGTITKVTVTLKRFNHGNYADVAILLQSPSGKMVYLMGNCMDAAFDTTERNITLDDDAGSDIPELSRPAGVDHTYRPTIYGGQITTWPQPCPAPDPGPLYATDLSEFIGEDPNGAWALWVVDDSALDWGYFLNGWDLTITAA